MRKRNPEPAESLLQKEAAAEGTLSRDGFLGALYQPDVDAYPGKAMILVGGSDGYYSLTRLIAEQYVGRGLTVLALAWWNRECLPREICHVPLEYAENAALWLKARGYEKIAMAGISMGAEYALLAAAYFPELISCCVAISPMAVCTQGIQKKNQWHRNLCLLEGAAFSYRGEDLPFAPLSFRKGRILSDSLKKREMTLNACYEGVLKGKRGWIPVEEIRGPLLLLAAEADSMWPSRQAAEAIKKRRDAAGLPTEAVFYSYASHLLLPYPLKSRKMFRMERKYPEACWKSDLDSFQKTLQFLSSW